MVPKVLLSVACIAVLMSCAGTFVLTPDREACGRTAALETWFSDVECVRLTWCQYDQAAYPLEVDITEVVEIYSNGTVLWHFESDIGGSVWNESHLISIPDEVLDQVLVAMDAEGFGSMEERYYDARASLVVPSTYTLTAVGPSSNQSVVFESETIAGLMHQTYCSILCAGNEDVSVDVSVTELSPLLYEVSCVVSNDRDVDFTLGACAQDCWYFSVFRENGCRFNEQGSALPMCITTLGPHEELVFTPKVFNASGLPDGSYWVFMNAGPVGLAPLTIEGNDAYVNSAPVDRGNEMIREAASSDVWTIELRGCCDLEDRQEDILVRWDWESDGVWDSEFSSEKSVTRAFEDPNEVNVTYELKDTDGAVTTGMASVSTETSTAPAFAVSLVLAVGAALVVVAILVAVIILSRRRRGTGP